MEWDVEYTDEFGQWWDGLTEKEQEDIDVIVGLLEAKGPEFPYPHSSAVQGSRHGYMRELRVAILLIGGDKTSNDRWYDENIPLADRLYDQHLDELKREGGL